MIKAAGAASRDERAGPRGDAAKNLIMDRYG